MQTFDFSPLFRSYAAPANRFAGAPDYDLIKTGDNEFRVSLAVPGFAESEISVETQDGALWISGHKETDPDHNGYIHNGLQIRDFQRSFQLPEHVKVTSARLDSGLLHVDLVRELPESLKPRKIEIEVNQPRRLEDASRAA